MKVHIIGGTGSMGNWLKNFLESQGMVVTVSGSKGVEDQILRNSDIIFISVPISKASEVILETARKIKEDTLLVDMSSIISETAEALEKTNKPAVSIHFLFGPTISSIQNQKIIFCHSGERSDARIDSGQARMTFLKELFTNAGGQIIEMTPKEHDLYMAHVQNLTHFINLSLAKTLINNNINLSGKVSTPVFLAQLSTLSRVISQSPSLLAEIQLGNKLSEKVLEDHISYQKKLLNLIKDKDEKKLIEEFNKIHQSIDSTPKKKDITNKRTTSIKKLPNKPLKLAYLGPEGTFSHQAATMIISSDKQSLVPSKNIYEIFEKVGSNEVDYGIVPAENSTEGTVRETLDYLMEFDLRTSFGVDLVIHQTLMSKEKSLKDIKRVISHPQAIAQSRDWLRENLPYARVETASSTIAAAKDEESKGIAVIGSILAAKTYNLNILSEEIEDHSNNVTRFYVISKLKNQIKVEKTKTMLYLSIFNRVGILRDILDVFATHNINLTKMESRPSREKLWDYHFFIELDIHQEDPQLIDCLNILKQLCPMIIVLGGV